MFKDDGEGKISMSNKELSKKINMSESTISRCDKALEEKEYLQIINSSNRDLETGLKIREKYYHLNSLQQAIVFVLKNHEDRISENTEEINNLKKEIESLKNQMEIWKQKS
jgi:DNA-binding MarR family transcriptional regulator